MKILLIGCGNIGTALLKIWVQHKLCEEIVVIQPSMQSSPIFNNQPYIKFIKNDNAIPKDFVEDVTVIAVKPQNIQSIIPYLSNRNSNSLIVSVLAGIQIENLCALLPNHRNIIRVMPNVAIKTGNSINIAFALNNIEEHVIAMFKRVFTPSGHVIFVKQESQIDLLTPVSGSGPAYFFLLAELLLLEVRNIGLNDVDAKKMVDQLLIGAASLVQENIKYEDLIASVASKKGVTEVALEIIRPRLKQVLEEALNGASIRLSELSDGVRHQNMS